MTNSSTTQSNDNCPIKKRCKLGDLPSTINSFAASSYNILNSTLCPKLFLSNNISSHSVLHHNDTINTIRSDNNNTTNETNRSIIMPSPSKDFLNVHSASSARASTPLQTLCSMACQERVISAPLQLSSTINTNNMNNIHPSSILYTTSIKREDSDMSISSHLSASLQQSSPSRLTSATPSICSSIDTINDTTQLINNTAAPIDRTTEKKLKHIQTDRDRRARIKNSLSQLRVLLGMSNTNTEQSTILSSSVALMTQLQQENACLQNRLNALQCTAIPVTAAIPVNHNNVTNTTPTSHTAVDSSNEIAQLQEHINTLHCRLDRELKNNSLLNLERRELSSKLEHMNAINQQLSTQLHNTLNKQNHTTQHNQILTNSASVDTLHNDLSKLPQLTITPSKPP